MHLKIFRICYTTPQSYWIELVCYLTSSPCNFYMYLKHYSKNILYSNVTLQTFCFFIHFLFIPICLKNISNSSALFCPNSTHSIDTVPNSLWSQFSYKLPVCLFLIPTVSSVLSNLNKNLWSILPSWTFDTNQKYFSK